MNKPLISRQIHLASRPRGMPVLTNFNLVEVAIDQIKDREVLIQPLYLSVDPYMRGRMRGQSSSHTPFELNQCLNGKGIGRVVQSNSDRFKMGDHVVGYLQWSDYSINDENALQRIESPLPVTLELGLLGSPGMTAYFGMLDIGKPKPGETVVVSSAAGAVGMAVGQIAKIKACRVIGMTGSDEKVDHLLHHLNFDGAINYKKPQFRKDLINLCPNGVDIYFDNVGGKMTDDVLSIINKHARVVLCGQISTYHNEEPDTGLRHFRTLIVKSALAQGLIVHDYKDRFSEGKHQMAEWIAQGKIKNTESILEGLENMPQALLNLFTGKNLGKQLVKI